MDKFFETAIETFFKLIAGAGLMLFLIGASSMDSPNIFIPSVATITGLVLLALWAWHSKI